jgi:RNA polymerase sigma factor (sigma-70 family)
MDAVALEPEDLSRDLVVRARAGDVAARDALAQQLVRPAYLLALQLLGDAEEARDVAQEALLRFFASLPRVDPERPPRPWLFAIVRNRVRDLRRHRRRWRTEAIERANEGYVVEPAGTDGDPELERGRGELRRAVWRALGVLADGEREILVLRDYHDLRYTEIAELLGIPIGTVMSRLHRARRALRDVLAERGWSITGAADT